MLNKILVLFLMWIAIGFVGYFWKTVVFDIKIIGINKEKGDELICEAVSMLSRGAMNVNPDKLNRKEGRKELYNNVFNSVIILELIKQWIFWPHTFAMLDQMYGEVYEQMLNKYRQPEKTDVPS